MKDRFTAEYAASTEVTTVLRQGSDIQRFMATQPTDLDGASEWTRLASSLGDLATVYGTTFPLPEGRQARRMNDREVKKAAEEVADSADRFKRELDSSLKKDKSVSQTTREAAVDEANELKEDAKKLASVVGDGRPSSGEAKALLDRASRIRGASPAPKVSPTTQAAWSAVEANLDKVAQAFTMSLR
jgi:hypothetical protein